MKLLTEITDIAEMNRIRFLLESNGIPVFVGNEDSARSMGFIGPAAKHGIFIIYDEQFQDAKCLLKDETHEVKQKVDMDEFRRNMELIQPNAFNQLFKAALILGGVLAGLFVVFVWIVE
jgi:hypothetical protein